MKKFNISTVSISVSILVLLVVLGGCTNTPVPISKMAVAEAAVERVNTPTISKSAPGELQIAIAKLASAKQALLSNKRELAGQLAEEATLDAQVAEHRALSVDSRIAAQESQDAARVLREEINRNNIR